MDMTRFREFAIKVVVVTGAGLFLGMSKQAACREFPCTRSQSDLLVYVVIAVVVLNQFRLRKLSRSHPRAMAALVVVGYAWFVTVLARAL